VAPQDGVFTRHLVRCPSPQLAKPSVHHDQGLTARRVRQISRHDEYLTIGADVVLAHKSIDGE
jgi:hypothetical protein